MWMLHGPPQLVVPYPTILFWNMCPPSFGEHPHIPIRPNLSQYILQNPNQQTAPRSAKSPSQQDWHTALTAPWRSENIAIFAKRSTSRRQWPCCAEASIPGSGANLVKQLENTLFFLDSLKMSKTHDQSSMNRTYVQPHVKIAIKSRMVGWKPSRTSPLDEAGKSKAKKKLRNHQPNQSYPNVRESNIRHRWAHKLGRFLWPTPAAGPAV